MARTFKLLSPGMRQMLSEGFIEHAVRGPAERMAARAKATAPVATGAYRNGIHVEIVRTDRVVARIVASDPKSALIEARTGNLVRSMFG